MFATFTGWIVPKRESDELYVESVRKVLQRLDRTQRALQAILVIGFAISLGPIIGLVLQFVPAGGLAPGFALGVLGGSLFGMYVNHELQTLVELAAHNFRDKRLMLRYHDALQGMMNSTATSEPRP
jgi:hypothetical protein